MNEIQYVTEYEYAAVALLMVLMGLYAARRKFHTLTNSLFLAMMFYAFLSSILHIVTTKTMWAAEYLPMWFNYAVNIGYMLSYVTISVMYLIYVITLTKGSPTPLGDKIFASSVLFLYIILIALTPWTKAVFYFDENSVYRHGPLFAVLPISAAVILAYSMLLFFRHRRKMKFSQNVAIAIFALFTTLSTAVQIFLPEQIISNFVISLSLVMFFISLENPAEYINSSTGCPNADAFCITAEYRINSGKKFGAVAFRPDGLNYFTDLLGFKESSKICADIAEKLKATLRIPELYYLGNWEFAAIADNKHGVTVESLAEGMRDFFSRPITINGAEVAVTAYICTLKYPGFVKSAKDMKIAIDYTLKSMEKRGETFSEAEPEAIAAKQRETKILADIKQCILNSSFEMYYQPLYNVEEGSFVCAEALIRMRDSELGYISPEEFIPLAETNGLIVQVGEIAFREVCEFLKSGQAQKLGVKYIEVNLSVIQCVQEKLATQLIEIMDEYGIDPASINFEITETAGLANYDILVKNMKRLIAHGASFSMDDFGTGFSTANYLIALPTDIVKIDKSILWPAMENDEAFIVLRHTVEMLKSLRKKIVVEGVETAEMVKLLSEIGCDYLQGYYYSKPVPAGDYIAFLEKNENRTDGAAP